MTITAKKSGIHKDAVSLEILDNKTANALVTENHYLHRPRVGKLLSYKVLVEGRDAGVLMFARAPVSHPMFSFAPTEIVELARVWFRNNEPNLGSCSIRKALKRLHVDWPGTKAVISWCDTSRFNGALYKATGFQFVGTSRVRSLEKSAVKFGGGRAGRVVQTDRLTPKHRYLIRLPQPKVRPAPRVPRRRAGHVPS